MSDKEKQPIVYIAKCSCGGWVMMTTDTHKEDAAKSVAEMIKEGFTIETTSVEEARKQKPCEHSGRCLTETNPLFDKLES